MYEILSPKELREYIATKKGKKVLSDDCSTYDARVVKFSTTWYLALIPMISYLIGIFSVNIAKHAITTSNETLQYAFIGLGIIIGSIHFPLWNYFWDIVSIRKSCSKLIKMHDTDDKEKEPA